MLGPWVGCVILESVAWEAARETSDELTGEGFGLKNPFRLLWPGADDVGVAKDFERFGAVLVDGGSGRFRGAAAGEGRGGSRESAVTSVPCFPVGFAAVADRLDGAGGLRENMSLMLRRLSTSNSGSKRPDAGRRKRFEYSWRR